MMSIWNRGHQDREGLSPADQRIFDLLMVRIVASYGSAVFQHENGAYDDELMDNLTEFVASLLSTAGGQSWYESGRVPIARVARERLDARRASDS
jgi:hypothetical protein